MRFAIRLLVLNLIFATTVLALISSNRLQQAVGGHPATWSAVFGLIFGAGLFALVSFFVKKRNSTALIGLFRWREAFIGMAIALIAFNFSLAAFSFTNKLSVKFPAMSTVVDQMLYQIQPAVIEEVGFRFGLALLAMLYFNRNAGILAGTIPLALLHLIYFLSGQPISFAYILGSLFMGGLLTLVFFRYGLIAAIFCHYTWNVFASVAAKSFSFQQTALETSYVTAAILLFITVRIWLQLRRLV